MSASSEAKMLLFRMREERAGRLESSPLGRACSWLLPRSKLMSAEVNESSPSGRDASWLLVRKMYVSADK